MAVLLIIFISIIIFYAALGNFDFVFSLLYPYFMPEMKPKEVEWLAKATGLELKFSGSQAFLVLFFPVMRKCAEYKVKGVDEQRPSSWCYCSQQIGRIWENETLDTQFDGTVASVEKS